MVGYFVLGPSDLYKLVKEIGKFVQNIRTLGTDLTTTFESNMESQLQLEELRKAQRELNDAFSFRRSINTDETSDAFSTTATTPRPDEAAAEVRAPGGLTNDWISAFYLVERWKNDVTEQLDGSVVSISIEQQLTVTLASKQ